MPTVKDLWEQMPPSEREVVLAKVASEFPSGGVTEEVRKRSSRLSWEQLGSDDLLQRRVAVILQSWKMPNHWAAASAAQKFDARYKIRDKGSNTWQVIDTQTGKVVLDDETYQVAANLEHALNTGAKGTSEADELAESIAKHSAKKFASPTQAQEVKDAYHKIQDSRGMPIEDADEMAQMISTRTGIAVGLVKNLLLQMNIFAAQAWNAATKASRCTMLAAAGITNCPELEDFKYEDLPPTAVRMLGAKFSQVSAGGLGDGTIEVSNAQEEQIATQLVEAGYAIGRTSNGGWWARKRGGDGTVQHGSSAEDLMRRLRLSQYSAKFAREAKFEKVTREMWNNASVGQRAAWLRESGLYFEDAILPKAQLSWDKLSDSDKTVLDTGGAYASPPLWPHVGTKDLPGFSAKFSTQDVKTLWKKASKAQRRQALNKAKLPHKYALAALDAALAVPNLEGDEGDRVCAALQELSGEKLSAKFSAPGYDELAKALIEEAKANGRKDGEVYPNDIYSTAKQWGVSYDKLEAAVMALQPKLGFRESRMSAKFAAKFDAASHWNEMSLDQKQGDAEALGWDASQAEQTWEQLTPEQQAAYETHYESEQGQMSAAFAGEAKTWNKMTPEQQKELHPDAVGYDWETLPRDVRKQITEKMAHVHMNVEAGLATAKGLKAGAKEDWDRASSQLRLTVADALGVTINPRTRWDDLSPQDQIEIEDAYGKGGAADLKGNFSSKGLKAGAAADWDSADPAARKEIITRANKYGKTRVSGYEPVELQFAIGRNWDQLPMGVKDVIEAAARNGAYSGRAIAAAKFPSTAKYSSTLTKQQLAAKFKSEDQIIEERWDNMPGEKAKQLLLTNGYSEQEANSLAQETWRDLPEEVQRDLWKDFDTGRFGAKATKFASKKAGFAGSYRALLPDKSIEYFATPEQAAKFLADKGYTQRPDKVAHRVTATGKWSGVGVRVEKYAGKMPAKKFDAVDDAIREAIKIAQAAGDLVLGLGLVDQMERKYGLPEGSIRKRLDKLGLSARQAFASKPDWDSADEGARKTLLKRAGFGGIKGLEKRNWDQLPEEMRTGLETGSQMAARFARNPDGLPFSDADAREWIRNTLPKGAALDDANVKAAAERMYDEEGWLVHPLSRMKQWMQEELHN